MPATLRLTASLKKMLNLQDEYPAEAGESVRAALIRVGIKPELVAMVSVNGTMETKDYVIKEKDVVRLLAVIGGG
jgi:sulfur carrier protein ThiS